MANVFAERLHTRSLARSVMLGLAIAPAAARHLVPRLQLMHWSTQITSLGYPASNCLLHMKVSKVSAYSFVVNVAPHYAAPIMAKYTGSPWVV